ncbi:MAG: hypothetical protein J7J33_01465 [Caldisericia bacterium]|nr:hypothetical protein [Caldisericia bacterium]
MRKDISGSYRVLTRNDFGYWEEKVVVFLSKTFDANSKIIVDWEIINFIDAPDEVFASIINRIPINKIFELDVRDTFSRDERKAIISLIKIKEGEETGIRRVKRLINKVRLSKNSTFSRKLILYLLEKKNSSSSLPHRSLFEGYD